MLKLDESTFAALSGLSRTDDPFCLFSQGPDDAERQIDDALSGRHDSIRTKFLERLKHRRDDDIDDLSASLLAHLGIDPLAAAVLAAIMEDDGFYVMDSESEEDCLAFVKSEKHHQDGYVVLSEDVQWMFNGTLMMPPLPETVLAALPGRKLNQALAHPVLDAFPHTIASARVERGQQVAWTHITTPRRAHVRLRLDQLAAHRPVRLKEAA